MDAIQRAYRYKKGKTMADVAVFLQAFSVERGECWLSRLPKDKDGYGITKFGGKTCRAHRLMLVARGDALKHGQLVMHSCDTPACVNPAHLSPATIAANNEDRSRKGRNASGSRNGAFTKPERVRRGVDNGAARLTAENVLDIRASYQPGLAESIGQHYGVSKRSIYNIVSRRTWSHV